jgi:hypothetical protein
LGTRPYWEWFQSRTIVGYVSVVDVYHGPEGTPPGTCSLRCELLFNNVVNIRVRQHRLRARIEMRVWRM